MSHSPLHGEHWMKQTNHSFFDSFFTKTSSSAWGWNWIMCNFKMRLPIPKLLPSDSHDMSSSSSSLLMTTFGNRLCGLIEDCIVSALVCMFTVQWDMRQPVHFQVPEKQVFYQYLWNCTITGYRPCSCNFEKPFIQIYILVVCLTSLAARQCLNLFHSDHKTIHQIRCQEYRTEAFSFDTFTTFFQIWNNENEMEKLKKSAQWKAFLKRMKNRIRA